ncbi:transforming acidic coiled-coil-containing protein-domain containing protein [Syncephalis fuscata]|nr:transforming acidic coiled-coil-containing protein-domain containing protein [Syncephalis fuscata]
MAQETPPPCTLDDKILTSIAEFDPLTDLTTSNESSTSINTTTAAAAAAAAATVGTAKKDSSDWMLQFETPAPQRSKVADMLTARRSRIEGTSRPSMLDLSFEFATPRSAPTYSERDMERIRADAEVKAEEQVAQVRHELEKYQKALSKETQTKKQLESLMNEFEATMKRMIDDSKNERANYSTTMATITEERDLLQDHMTKVEHAFEELKKRYNMRKTENEALRRDQDTLLKTIERLESDNGIYKERFDKLKAHAEEQLDYANVTLAEIRIEHEKELATLRATNLRMETRVKQLESTVETKTRENTDLMKLCDDIISRVEGGIA